MIIIILILNYDEQQMMGVEMAGSVGIYGVGVYCIVVGREKVRKW